MEVIHNPTNKLKLLPDAAYFCYPKKGKDYIASTDEEGDLYDLEYHSSVTLSTLACIQGPIEIPQKPVPPLPEIKEGQVWKMRNGKRTVVQNNTYHPAKTVRFMWFTEGTKIVHSNTHMVNRRVNSPYDLVELILDAEQLYPEESLPKEVKSCT